MKKTLCLRLFTIFLCSLITLSTVSSPVWALEINKDGFEYYQVISKRDWELAPGITESEIVLNNNSGDKRQVNHVVEIDIKNPYTKVMPSANGMAEGLNSKKYGTQTMSDQAKYAEEHGYGNVVAAMNTALHWYDTDYYKKHPELIGEPLGTLIMDGVRYTNSQNSFFGAYTCLVVNFDEKDGVSRPDGIPKTEIRQTYDAITGWEEQLIPTSFHFLVKNGVNQHVINDPTEPAPRSFLGIKEDGTIVIVMNEGRQAPYSTGFNCYEMAEFMLSLGCVHAINGDGGGSSAFLSQRPGEDLELHCSPSDGTERPTTHGVLVISTAPSSGEFVKANISAESDYYTPNSSVNFSVVGFDLNGSYADVPENATWKLSDNSFGTIDNGLFVSNGKEGEVTVQLTLDGEVVGEDTIFIVKPNNISFTTNCVAVPYGEKVKIPFMATYNGNNVTLQNSDVNFTLSDNSIGSVEGFYFTAAEEGVDSTNVTLTATIFGKIETVDIILGKASKLVYSFENDEDLSSGWSIQPSFGNGSGNIQIVNRSDGKVKNGDYSLAVTCDFTEAHFTDANILKLTFPGIDCTDATQIGFWVYIPYDAYYSCLSFAKGCGMECFFGCNHNCNINQKGEGWYYATASIGSDNIVDSIEFKMIDTLIDENYADYGWNLNGKYTFYIDDITVDYSDAVSDRYSPVFSDFVFVKSGTSYKEKWIGQTIGFGSVGFEYALEDDTCFVNASGIDEKSVKAWIDGVEVDCVYRDGKIIVSEAALSNGLHSVKFEASDNEGNYSTSTFNINVQGSVDVSSIKVVPQNPSVDRLPIGAIYWMDLIATDIETIDKVTAVFDLNNASSWEFDGITVLDGFTASYAVQPDDNIATIVIERTGENKSVGEVVLASVPVRTWVSNCEKAPADLVKDREFWAQRIEISFIKGEISYVDSYKSEVIGAFGMDRICVSTELFFNGICQNLSEEEQAWIDNCVLNGVGFHKHVIGNVMDKAPTATQPGYTERAFCKECCSVVIWGETIPATGHTYSVDVNNQKIVCVCGDEHDDTGLLTIDGKSYYAANGKLSNGWISFEDSWYYFDKTTFAGADGEQYADNSVRFIFDKGRVTQGTWTRNSTGYRYWYGPGYYRDTSTEKTSCRPYEIDGKTYLFDRSGYMQTGIARFYDSNITNSSDCFVYYDCGTNGVATVFTGCYEDYFYINGTRVRTYKLVQDKAGDYYFVNDGHKIAKDRRIYLSAQFVSGNTFADGTPLYVGYYDFDSDGKMIVKQGPIGDYFYLNGVQQKAYKLVEFEGHYYFIDKYNKLAKNTTIYLTETFTAQYGLAVGKYVFDEDGKLIIKHGPIGDYFYLNDVLQKAYKLVEFEGYYYFIDKYNKLAKNTTIYLTETFTAQYGLAVGKYAFDADGKMIIKNGPIGDYFYLNDVQQKAYKLVEFEGNYYFIDKYNKLAKNTTVYLTETFTAQHGLAAGKYEFDADGKMIVRNGVIGDYLYLNGVQQKSYKLIEFEGDFYFINDGNKVAKNKTIYLNEVFIKNKVLPNGAILEVGKYDFDADGKMVLN